MMIATHNVTILITQTHSHRSEKKIVCDDDAMHRCDAAAISDSCIVYIHFHAYFTFSAAAHIIERRA